MLARLDSEGCARYVVTDVTKDGTLKGPNLSLLREVCAERGLAAIVNIHDVVLAREFMMRIVGLRAGRIVFRESVAEGIEAAPGAFIGMLEGRNFGKQLVRVAAPS